MDSVKPIYKYLQRQNSQIVDLVTYGQILRRVTKSLKKQLNQGVEGNFQVCNISGQEITLLVYSAELATRLRYQAANLLQEIRKLESCELLNKINIKVRPEMVDQGEMKGSTQKALLIPSTAGKQHLKLLANNIDDPALKAALQRLAGRISPD